MATKKSSATGTSTLAKKSPAKKLTVKKAPATAKSAEKEADKKQKKGHKEKVIRDSFTMPENEYRKIAVIKAVCLKNGLHVKKSEVLRAALKALAELDATQLKRALSSLEKIKTGRPKKH